MSKSTVTLGVNEVNTVRLYCHGCTRPAAFAPRPHQGQKVVCPHCGKEQVSELKNWLPL